MKYFQDESGKLSHLDMEGKFAFTTGVSARINASERDIPFEEKEGLFIKNAYRVAYGNEKISAEAEIIPFVNNSVLRQQTTYTANTSLTLTRATGANVHGVCFSEEGISQRLNDGSILVHYCVSRWQGEGQWRTDTPERLGLYSATEHGFEKSWCRFQSLSSWSTATYAPIIIIEDRIRRQSWFFTIECGRSWFFELYAYGGRKGMKELSVVFGGADEQLGFAKQMKEGEQYVSAECAFGTVIGGFEEAIQSLVQYWRESSLVKGGSPLVFNDYMNCNWTNESTQTLLPLIDKAAELGCEVFCLDDGWQKAQGIWFPADEKFDDGGLQGIFSYIRARGMQIGVWFEFETVPLRVRELIDADDCFLFRNGEMVAPNRPLANFRSKKLVDYLNRQVDALYAMGVRFIKNDHNNAEYLGSTLYGECAAEGLEKNEQAFLAFIDGIRKRYPDLVLENCASGAMRSDAGTLKHFHIQSTSDQEDYLLYPSILTGSLALMPPEKAGIWCYPYPLCFKDKQNLELNEEQLLQFADGEQTVFNVVNGFMGNLYLSGKIHQADAYNTQLLKEGLDLYMEEREKLFESVPVFPCGTISISDRKPHAIGLWNEKEETLFLAVWNLSESADNLMVDLSRYQRKTCELRYPIAKQGVNYAYQKGTLKVSFDSGRIARLFVLK